MIRARVENLEPTMMGPQQRSIPGIQLKVNLSSEQGSGKCTLHAIHAQLLHSGGIVSQSVPIYVSENFGEGAHVESTFFFPMPRHTIAAIESRRADDVHFTIHISGLGSVVIDKAENTAIKHLNATYDWPQSQRQWLDTLTQLGYTDSWVVEIERPGIEGWDVVEQHLKSAASAIERRDFEKAVSDCRVAWEAVDPLLNAMIDKLKDEIDRGSPGEDGQPSKSSRILSLKDAAHKFSQIGVHREAYGVSPEDALLCYHTTISLLAHLSRYASKVE